MDTPNIQWFTAQWESFDFSINGLLPELIIAGWLLVLILAIVLRSGPWIVDLTIGALALFGAGLLAVLVHPGADVQSGMVTATPFGRYLQGLMVLATAWSLLQFRLEARGETGESQILPSVWMITALLGGFLLVHARHFMLLFLALELISIPSYLLVSRRKGDVRAAEAGLKYLLYGVFASAIMLYGISWVYGWNHSLGFAAGNLATAPQFVQIVLVMLILVGFAFKAGFFPFQLWLPDTYQGATYYTATFLSLVPKIAAFGALWHFSSFWNDLPAAPMIRLLLLGLAMLTMLAGNLGALWQDHFRRLMAFSGISHVGFLLMAVAVGERAGGVALGFYLGIYTLMNAGGFMGGFLAEQKSGSALISGWSGLGKSASGWSAAWAVCLVSLAGLPPTSGFIAKWLVFAATWERLGSTVGWIWGVAIAWAALNAVLSLYYYLKVPAELYFHAKNEQAAPQRYSWGDLWMLLVAIPVLLLGFIGFDRFIEFISQIVWNF